MQQYLKDIPTRRRSPQNLDHQNIVDFAKDVYEMVTCSPGFIDSTY